MTSVYEAWKEDWFKQEASNQFLITDPAICLPGFDLKRKDWTLLKSFRTGHGRCAATSLVPCVTLLGIFGDLGNYTFLKTL